MRVRGDKLHSENAAAAFNSNTFYVGVFQSLSFQITFTAAQRAVNMLELNGHLKKGQ